MLSLATHYKCLDSVAAVVAALTVKDLFTFNAVEPRDEEEGDTITATAQEANAEAEEGGVALKKAMRQARAIWTTHGVKGGGDLAALLSALGAADHGG